MVDVAIRGVIIDLSPAMVRSSLPTVVDVNVDLILAERLHQIGEVIHFAREIDAAGRSRE